MKTLKSIFRLSKLMLVAIRCRVFRFLLTILQILLIASSSYSSDSKVVSSKFSFILDLTYVLSKRIYLCVFELKITVHFPGLAFI